MGALRKHGAFLGIRQETGCEALRSRPEEAVPAYDLAPAWFAGCLSLSS